MLAGGLMAAPILSELIFFQVHQMLLKLLLIGCGGRGTGACMQAMLSKQKP